MVTFLFLCLLAEICILGIDNRLFLVGFSENRKIHFDDEIPCFLLCLWLKYIYIYWIYIHQSSEHKFVLMGFLGGKN